jgi:hypothetical protein
MPKNRFVEVVIPLYFEGHVYRAGSRIRVVIAAPNGAQPIWAFGETKPARTSRVSIAFSIRMPSALILPVAPGVRVPSSAAGLPPCPSLRNEPCRGYVPFANRTLTVSSAGHRRTSAKRATRRQRMREAPSFIG